MLLSPLQLLSQPAVLAMDGDGKLLDLEEVEAQELVYAHDRRDRARGLPNAVSEMNDSLRTLWDGEAVMDWPNLCPDGTVPSSTKGPSVGRTTREVGFDPAELFEAEPELTAASTQAKGRGSKPQRARR